MNELADSIKRLRSVAQVKVPHCLDAIPNCHGENYQQAVQTINALVDLVAELYDPSTVEQKSDALAKAGVLLSKLGDL